MGSESDDNGASGEPAPTVEQACYRLREDAQCLLEGFDALDYGLGELGLPRGHALLDGLEKARALVEHVMWSLGSEAFRAEVGELRDDEPTLPPPPNTGLREQPARRQR